MTDKANPQSVPTHEEVVLDLSTSCTREQAAMRMLGWGKADVYKKAIPITSEGISLADLQSMHPATMTLEERLNDLTENARQALIQAAEDGASFEVIHERNTAVEEVRDLVAKARSFLMDIDDELDKGDKSALRVDQQATQRTGETHVNLRSLDKWIAARKSIVDIDENSRVGQQRDETRETGRRSKAEDSLYVTLAIAVTAFARRAGGKFLKSGVPAESVSDSPHINMSTIYTHLAELASSQVEGDEFPDQSLSSIKGRVSEAFERRRRALKR
jgi:hypothetical protein